MGSWGGSEVTPQTPGTHRVPGQGAGGPRPAWDVQPGGAAAAAGAPGRGPSAQAPRGPAAAEPHGRAARPPDSPANLEAWLSVRSGHLWHQNRQGAG